MGDIHSLSSVDADNAWSLALSSFRSVRFRASVVVVLIVQDDDQKLMKKKFKHFLSRTMRTVLTKWIPRISYLVDKAAE